MQAKVDVTNVEVVLGSTLEIGLTNKFVLELDMKTYNSSLNKQFKFIDCFLAMLFLFFCAGIHQCNVTVYTSVCLLTCLYESRRVGDDPTAAVVLTVHLFTFNIQ